MSNAVYIPHIWYVGQHIAKPRCDFKDKSLQPIGIDTEAYKDGKCFMIATSLGDVFTYEQFPYCMFNRRYRNKTFVAYNLSYDAGHLISWLPYDKIRELWKTGRVEYECFIVKSIPRKFLRITKNKKDSITFYDMLNFYKGAGTEGKSDLDSVAEKILQERKIDIATKSFTRTYVKKHWQEISKYCIKDAVLVERLGNKIIAQFEEWGVYPRALYSTAYVTYQYFIRKTKYVTVKRFWQFNRMLLDYAMLSYNGGKFEVTRKGVDYYYEYDITSAYPYEIANLIDITHAKVKHLSYYDKNCTYGFIKCIIDIPVTVYSPIALKYGSVNIYPVGRIKKVITKDEYEYLESVGCKIMVIDGYFLYVNNIQYPYRNEILRLFEYKKQYKKSGNKLLYHTIKILLNSLYGKFVQIVKSDGKYRTTTCWNPIYGAIITANTRIRISRMQQLFPSVVAVHTDSVISTKKLDIPLGKELGDWTYETEGEGVVLGSGIYQIGNTSKYRGVRCSKPLLEMINKRSKYLRFKGRHVFSWREVAFHGWDINTINRFVKDNKKLDVQFDKKRLWLDDYSTFAQALKRHVYSVPYFVGLLDCKPPPL